MTLDELNAKRDQLLKDLETVGGEAVHQIKAQIAAVEWEIDQLTPKEEPKAADAPEEPA